MMPGKNIKQGKF